MKSNHNQYMEGVHGEQTIFELFRYKKMKSNQYMEGVQGE